MIWILCLLLTHHLIVDYIQISDFLCEHTIINQLKPVLLLPVVLCSRSTHVRSSPHYGNVEILNTTKR